MRDTMTTFLFRAALLAASSLLTFANPAYASAGDTAAADAASASEAAADDQSTTANQAGQATAINNNYFVCSCIMHSIFCLSGTIILELCVILKKMKNLLFCF